MVDEVIVGDCIEVMATWPADSVDAVCTDPPYGIGFMGHEWDQPGYVGPKVHVTEIQETPRLPRFVGDHNLTTERSGAMQAGRYDLSLSANQKFQAWCEAWGREMLRVAKPGAHALVFGSTRTSHRMVAGLEDAGWEVRDTLVWAYADGMPKSLNLEGGLGTSLKPAWEPIVLVRKPFPGTVTSHVLAHGTGALNIDATRIPFQSDSDRLTAKPGGRTTSGSSGHIAEPNIGQKGERHEFESVQSAKGRWPPNVVLTDPIFDGDIEGVVGGGQTATDGWRPDRRGKSGLLSAEKGFPGQESTGEPPGGTRLDSGTYSRFFLIAKPGRLAREPLVKTTTERENIHPTVKPVDLMRHLVRLVTPPDGIVLDCFLGSGTTALAAEQEGFHWLGIERNEEYAAIARARLTGHPRGLGI